MTALIELTTPVRILATAGHVDHGKSTLLHCLTGVDPDRWEEEHRRGLTIDLGFVWTELSVSNSQTVIAAFVDVPGHRRFVPNMLAGVGPVERALFVVAANEGWATQSQEHLEILDLLGVEGAVVVVTKTSLATTSRVEEVIRDVQRRLAGTSLADTPVLPVDSLTGEGITRLRSEMGRQLGAAVPAQDTGRARLWIDRAFSIRGAGTVVTGSLEGGSLRVGQEVAILPDGQHARVRALQAFGQSVARISPGCRVAVNLGGVDHHELGRGTALVTSSADETLTPDARWLTTQVVDARVRAGSDTAVGRRGSWHLHVGSAQVPVDVRPLLEDPIPAKGEQHARLLFDSPLPLQTGDRFVLRDTGRQVVGGGGEVLDPDPPVSPRGVDARLERCFALEEIQALVPSGRLERLLAISGGARPRARALAAVGHGTHAELPEHVTEIGEDLITATLGHQWATLIVERVKASASNGHVVGVTREELLTTLVKRGCPSRIGTRLLDQLTLAGELERDNTTYILPSQRARRAAEKHSRTERLVALLNEEPFIPRPAQEVVAEAGLGHDEVAELVRAGRVVRCEGLLFTREAIELAIEAVAELQHESGSFTTSQVRQKLNTTRKYAIPLLKHLDAVGVTRFDGEARHLIRPRDVLEQASLRAPAE